MKRFIDPTSPAAASKRKRPWKELWRRLLTDDDLDAVQGGGSPKPIITGNESLDDGCGGG